MKKNKSNKLKFTWISLFIIIVGLGIVLMLKPLFQNINYGLDLQGGFEILYEVDPIESNKKITNEMLLGTYNVLQKRIDSLGVSEPDITIEGKDTIRVKLAGVTNEEEARKQLGQVANLTFRDSTDKLLMTSDILKAGGARLTTDENGKPAVSLAITDNETFYNVTNKVKDMTDNVIVIWLDFKPLINSYAKSKGYCGDSASNCISAAQVSQAFASDVIISGNFSASEAQNLTDLINSGSLPTKLTEISSDSVNASLGTEALNKTLYAGIIGIILIIVFMITAYKFSGIIASFTILIYTFLSFLVFYLIGGVLTLPGLAAMVLGIGMAIDASVITFERIKEELYEGRNSKIAFKLGFKRSFTAILDANITTLIVAIILYIFGVSSVKGFATMLIISIIVTMFVMVYILKWVMKAYINSNVFEKHPGLFIGVKKNKIVDFDSDKPRFAHFSKLEFVKNRKLFFIISLTIIIIGMGFIFTKGFNLGIDYKGGTNITVMSNSNLNKSVLKDDLKELKLEAEDISFIDDNKGASIVLKGKLNEKSVHEVKNYFNEKYDYEPNVSVVSDVVKKELTKNALYSIIWAALGIIIYVTMRFTSKYAISAVVAILHDVLIVICFFSIFGMEINSIFIAAILTIIGYSINDTIVSYDRIRENLEKNKIAKSTKSLDVVVNKSIQETFTRTIFTALTTLFPVICLIFLGSFEIINFNIALFVGLIAGGYSSLFVAAQLWLIMESKQNKNSKTIQKKPKKIVKTKAQELDVKGINY